MSSLYFWWPIAQIVLFNVIYNICAKHTPAQMNPLAALTVTYLVSALASALCYWGLSGGNLLAEYRHLNWAVYVFGIALVGLETGVIYMYKVGWQVNTGHLTHGTILAVCLLFVGYFLYNETITWNKMLGVALCISGLYFLNR